MTSHSPQSTGLEIAVIGMAGRFPGAPSLDRFWENLINDRESLVPLSDEHLREQGATEEDLKDPAYLKIGGLLKNSDHFDAAFFGYSPREAAILDPQQRLFLECAWEALETAGYLGEESPSQVGVFAGAGMNGYLLNLYANSEIRKTTSPYEIFVGNDKDFLATRVSYKLNLCGPSMSIQTACSSSLVAVHTACQSLLSGECDLALAGGVAVSKQLGYRAQQGNIYSPDGHCRPFESRANGTVGGNGVGVVVLKRLEDALSDGDTIDAVIKGSAVTNDGAHKVSYTAPQVDSQAAAIRNALTLADVSAATISYIEAHGTGTAMGDPIEIAALTQAFREQTDQRQFCALGSVKSNIGHLDAAAGIAGFIKTVLALKNRQIPATLHFENPNPEIDFTDSPFRVHSQLSTWEATSHARRAGVSSFGIGGTNAHVILEEAPSAHPLTETRKSPQLLPVSAKSAEALAEMVTRLGQYFQKQPNSSLAHAAFTLQEGRRSFAYRNAVIADDISGIIAELEKPRDPTPVLKNPLLILLFPGQGSPSEGLSPDLLEIPPLCQEVIQSIDPSETITRECLRLFSQQYSLAKLVLDLGIRPAGLLGHSFGEIAAAALAGIFDLKDALHLVTLRSRLMEASPTGAMITVGCSPDKIAPFLNKDLFLAAHNAPDWITISGTTAAIESLKNTLKAEGLPTRCLPTARAFHSPTMDPVAKAVRENLTQISLNSPAFPIISSLTGTWLTHEEATNPDYWARQVREPVKFTQAVETAKSLPDPVFLELSPTPTLTNLVKQHGPLNDIIMVDQKTPSHLAAQLWTIGFSVRWKTLRGEERGRRIPLPTTPFQRSRFWIPPHFQAERKTPQSPVYLPTWKRLPPLSSPSKRQRWLIFGDASNLAEELEKSGNDVCVVEPGEKFETAGFRRFTVNPAAPQSFRDLLSNLADRETRPDHIVFSWKDAEALQNLALALTKQIYLSVITTSEEVLGTENLSPETPGLHGLALVLAQEFPHLSCRVIDLDGETSPANLANELSLTQGPSKVALRGAFRWEPCFENLELDQGKLPLDQTYFLVGDLSSELAKIWAKNLGLSETAKIVLLNTNPDLNPATWLPDFTPDWHATIPKLEDLADTFQSALKANGRPDGVFLCSPTTNQTSAAPLSLLSTAHWNYNHRTKAGLILALDGVLAVSNPRFVCVQSSLSSVLGGIGLGAYAAANVQLDQLIIARNRRGPTRWLGLNWDRIASDDSEISSGRFGGDSEPAFSAAEVWEITEKSLAQNISGILITSPTLLQDRLDHWVEKRTHSTSENQPIAQHTRPELTNAYLAPRTEIEKVIITIWEEFLGMQGIGAEDNFFALGGHSLLAIQIIARLRETFPVEIELRHLVSDNPTPASMVAILEADLPKDEQLDDMENLLAEIQELSPEEARSQLTPAAKS